MKLKNKIAFVTGAGNGIGRGIALRFAREGAKVAVADVARTAETVSQIRQNGGDAIALTCDVSNAAQIHEAVAAAVRELGPINVLVNNAAVMPTGLLHETSVEDFERCIDVNLRGTYLTSREVIPIMLTNGSGSIIHMASAAGMIGAPGMAIYSATKGAIIALTRVMSTDYAGYGIRVNCVSPGTIDSPMLHDFVARQNDQVSIRKAFDEMHPIGRVGTIDEVASVFVFLASDEASFVTGATYTVDGGLTTKGTQPQD